MLPKNLKIVKFLLRRFLVFWGIVFISSIVFTITATGLYVFRVPLQWQFWIALIVGTINMIAMFWLSYRATYRKGDNNFIKNNGAIND